jgi:hypothetical protein
MQLALLCFVAVWLWCTLSMANGQYGTCNYCSNQEFCTTYNNLQKLPHVSTFFYSPSSCKLIINRVKDAISMNVEVYAEGLEANSDGGDAVYVKHCTSGTCSTICSYEYGGYLRMVCNGIIIYYYTERKWNYYSIPDNIDSVEVTALGDGIQDYWTWRQRTVYVRWSMQCRSGYFQFNESSCEVCTSSCAAGRYYAGFCNNIDSSMGLKCLQCTGGTYSQAGSSTCALQCSTDLAVLTGHTGN